MQIFYTPDINGLEYIFNEEESKHAIRVLRMTEGEQLQLVDGKGNLFYARISDAHPKRCRILVENIEKDYNKRNYSLHIAISPLKNADRFEWFVEKSTEIGIDEITPLLCERTEKKGFNIERINRIVESAMKQSIKAFHPKINEPVKFNRFVETVTTDAKLIAFCEGERKLIQQVYSPAKAATILIGPEGDFTNDEVELAKVNGYVPVTLGASRLRTETAGVAACHSVYFMNM